MAHGRRDPGVPGAPARALVRPIQHVLHERQAPQPWQRRDRAVDLADRLPSLGGVAEQVQRERVDLLVGLDARAHRGPERPQRPAHDLPGAGVGGQARLGLGAVEGEVAALVLDHLGQHLVQDGVRAAPLEHVVAGQRGELVDRAPGHVQGDEVAHQHGAEHRG